MNMMGVILEYAQIGNAVEVRAIDPADGLEISFMAPIAAPQEEIELIALRKLDWVRRRRMNSASAAKDLSVESRRDRRGGILV